MARVQLGYEEQGNLDWVVTCCFAVIRRRLVAVVGPSSTAGGLELGELEG